jgi:hypothetical protein
LYLTSCRPNQLITNYLTGPFKVTQRTNKYLIVVIYHFTKFVEFYALSNSKARSVVEKILNDGGPEQILSDGGEQYQSKLLDSIYDYLDILRLKTTPFHPQCDGQSERTISTLKEMITAHVDGDQMTWDLNLTKLAFAYNSDVHASTQHTPFELMFGRQPKIPIDIIISNCEVLNREPILHEYELVNELGKITVLADPTELIKNNLPKVTASYLADLRRIMSESFQTASKHRNSKLEAEKIRHDRQIKPFEYKIGDLVLTDHPQLKKGLSQGLAHKYYGPYIFVGINDNKCDYFIRLLFNPKSRIKQIHQNRLKLYFHAGRPLAVKEEPLNQDERTPKAKRIYKKKPNNPRWKRIANNNAFYFD